MAKEARKIDIKLLSQESLIRWLARNGERSFRANQILKWVYQKQRDSFDDMSDLGKELKMSLKKNFSIDRLEIKAVQLSEDGSQKYVFILPDNNTIESVLIPEKRHLTLCVSSQVGCAQRCRFCMTAKNGFVRNLTSGEIIAQVRDVQKKIKSQSEVLLSNIVFMGMGEPLANYKEVIKAIGIISNGDYGLKISQRRITISTVGLIPKIKLMKSDTRVNLAVSLNAADNKTRNRIMPVNKIYPLENLIAACYSYRPTKRQRVTFEYVMIRGINDDRSDARKLADLLISTKAKINLIPLNEGSNCDYRKSPRQNILEFQKYLIGRNFTTTIRDSKGEDILGACGQLSNRYNENTTVRKK